MSSEQQAWLMVGKIAALIEERDSLLAELGVVVARVTELEAALTDLNEYAARMPGYSLHPLTERARAALAPTKAAANKIAMLLDENDLLRAARDEARHEAADMTAGQAAALGEMRQLLAENARLREAADAAMHELGVPQDHLTPAPVGNAYEILRAALTGEDTDE